MEELSQDDCISPVYYFLDMHTLTPYRLYFTVLGGILFFVLPFLQKTEEIRKSQAPTIPFDWDNLERDTIVFQDTLSDNVLYQIKNSEGIPLFYA